MTEWEWRAAVAYESPFHQAEVTATFFGPAGQRIQRPAFWDGGRTWKVRFAPPSVGRWTFVTRASDPADSGLHGQRGALECVPYRGALPIYRHGFLRVGDSGRHLAYRDGVPFLWLGDTHWLWESEPWDSAFRSMVDRRIAQGFTVYQVEFFQRWDGDTPHLMHFQTNIDPKWRYLADHGIVVASTHGLLERPTQPQTGAREARMARYLCARYGAYPAVWLMFQECTGHYASWFGSRAERTAFMAAVAQVGDAYRAADAYQQPRTAHSDAPLLTSYRDSDWLDFTLLQGGHDPVIDRDGYFDLYFENRRPLPQIEGEANYELLFDGADPGAPAPLGVEAMREKAYQAMQCGCAGYTYGANGVWQAVLAPNDSALHKVYGRTLWSRGIALPGGEQLRHWEAFYRALPWYRLQPRPECDGFATWDLALPPRQRPALAADPERATVVVYFYRGPATAGTLHRLTERRYQARWFDPRTGRYRGLGAIAPQHGQWRCPPKPDGDDWLLALTASPAAHRLTASIPFLWRKVQERRQAEKARNLAPQARISASSTDRAHPVYDPQHAVDGKSQVADWNHWSSDPAVETPSAERPAWLEMEWPAPVKIEKVRLYFMRNYETQDYAIAIDGRIVVEVQGNVETVREHVLPKATAMRKMRFLGRRGPKIQPNIVRLVEWEALSPGKAEGT